MKFFFFFFCVVNWCSLWMMCNTSAIVFDFYIFFYSTEWMNQWIQQGVHINEYWSLHESRESCDVTASILILPPSITTFYHNTIVCGSLVDAITLYSPLKILSNIRFFVCIISTLSIHVSYVSVIPFTLEFTAHKQWTYIGGYRRVIQMEQHKISI